MIPAPAAMTASVPLHPPLGCLGCRHLVITHDRAWPYACRAYGIRSRRPPWLEIELASGQPCRAREPRGAQGDEGRRAQSG